MGINQAGRDLIKKWEGLRLKPYQDIVGVWTVGWGHTGPDVIPGQEITQTEAEILLDDDLQKFEAGVYQMVTASMNENQYAALVSFAYNLGLHALEGSTLLKRFNDGDTIGASEEFLKWNHAGGKVVAGLTARRQSEKDLFDEVP